MRQYDSIDDYLADQPEPARGTLGRLRADLHRLVPDATEKVSYGCPALVARGKTFAGFARFARHNSYLPHSGSVLPALEAELAAYEHTKSSLHFPHGEPLPERLVRLLVEARLGPLD